MVNKIYVRMRGGLGNQLFQYAYALALDESDSSFKILDLREYETYKVRQFELFDFKLDNKTIINDLPKLKYDKKIKTYRLYQFLYRFFTGNAIHKISLNKVKKGYIFGGRTSPLPKIDLPDEVYLYGYFQNVNPLLKIRNKLIQCFSLKEEKPNFVKYKNLIQPNSVAVSVRYGKDAASVFTLPTKEYYEKAVDLILSNNSERQLVIYSDCIAQIREEKWFERFKNVLYVDNCSPCEQIELMKSNQDFILSNSSFSWWGAFLGGDMSKQSIICVPKIWYDNVPIDKTDLMFDDMRIIE